MQKTMYIRRSLTKLFNRSLSDISSLILKSDLYLTDKLQISTKKQANHGSTPSLYTRSAIQFDQSLIDRKSFASGSLHSIEEQTSIKSFLGEKFPLLAEETHSIRCGLSNFQLDLGQDMPRNSFNGGSLYESDKLRQIGKLVVKFHLDNNTVFAGRRHLSLPSTDIESDLKIFAGNPKLVPMFMKQNLLYASVIPYRGAMKWGPYSTKEEYDDMKLQIYDKTSIGSFYTLIGLLYSKFNKVDVIEFIDSKVLEGPNGLIYIASQNQEQ